MARFAAKSRNITLNIGVDVKKKFFRIHRDVLLAHLNVLRDSRKLFVGDMVAAIKEKNAVFEGDLSKSVGHSFETDAKSASIMIEVNSDYANAADLGLKRGRWIPISDSLVRWANAHGINVYALRAHIRYEGTKPHRYVTLAKRKISKRLNKSVKAHFRKIIRKFNS